MNLVEKDTADYIYYNVKITNDKLGVEKPVTFSENRVTPILYDPSQYHCSIERFNIPTNSIYIFLFRDGEYKITLTYQGNDFTQNVLWIPNADDTSLRYCWNYQSFLDMINETLASIFTALKTAHPLALPTESPYLTYDSNTQLITLNAEKAYTDPTNGIDIWFNDILFGFFGSFQSFKNIGNIVKSNRLIVQDKKTNGAVIGGKPYYLMIQEYTTLFLWQDIQTLLFISDSIPISNELLQSQKNVTRSSLFDFELTAGLSNKESYQYFADRLRWYDLISNQPLTKIDISVYFEDKYGDIKKMELNYRDTFTMKLVFKRRNKLARNIIHKLEN